MSEQKSPSSETDIPDIQQRFSRALAEQCQISKGDLLIAGISGGMDSEFLLEQLIQTGQPVIAAVFDHHLREESEVEADFVCQHCAERGIPCLRGSGDVKQIAEEEGLSYEETARNLRYQFLFKIARENTAAAVVTAHHADDQAETVLLHFLRGSGPDGLSGMQPRSLIAQFSPTIPLIRPMLGFWREEINCWIEQHHIPHITDYSNFDPAYTRNRIRLQLIPTLEADYNPKIKNNLLRLAEVSEMDLEVLNELTHDAWQQSVYHEDDHSVIFSREIFLSFRRGLQHRLLRRTVAVLQPQQRDLSLKSVRQAIEFFRGSRHNETRPWISGFVIACEGSNLMIFREDQRPQIVFYPQLEADAIPVGLWKPGLAEFSGWSIEVTELKVDDATRQTCIDQAMRDPFRACVDADRVSLPLVIRKARLGERFMPLGSNGHTQKLSDFWINIKLPRDYRENYALIADLNSIIWIPGLRISDHCAVEPYTTRVYNLRMIVAK